MRIRIRSCSSKSGDVLAVDQDLARVRFEQAENKIDDRRFAGAGAAEDDLRFAAADRKADLVQDDLVVKGKLDIAKFDRRQQPRSIGPPSNGSRDRILYLIVSQVQVTSVKRVVVSKSDCSSFERKKSAMITLIDDDDDRAAWSKCRRRPFRPVVFKP